MSIFSCKDNSVAYTEIELLQPIKEVEDLTSDVNKWWSYHYYQIVLSSDFIPLDESSKKISKEKFLKKLTTGNYITVEMQSNNELTTYKLFKLEEDSNKGIKSRIKSSSSQAYQHYKMEGISFPRFEDVDLDGHTFNNETFKNKKTIIKTWFIACKPCVAEMPELNELVNKYRDNTKIQFISLATDTKPLLKKFLTKQDTSRSLTKIETAQRNSQRKWTRHVTTQSTSESVQPVLDW